MRTAGNGFNVEAWRLDRADRRAQRPGHAAERCELNPQKSCQSGAESNTSSAQLQMQARRPCAPLARFRFSFAFFHAFIDLEFECDFHLCWATFTDHKSSPPDLVIGKKTDLGSRSRTSTFHLQFFVAAKSLACHCRTLARVAWIHTSLSTVDQHHPSDTHRGPY